MQFTCPSCGQEYELGAEAFDRKVQCACGQRFYVEAPDTPPAAAPPPTVEVRTPQDATPKPGAKKVFRKQPAPTTRPATVPHQPVSRWRRGTSLVVLLVGILLFLLLGNLWWDTEGVLIADGFARQQAAKSANSATAPTPQVARSDRPAGNDFLLSPPAPATPTTDFDLAAWKRQYANPATFEFHKWPTPYNGGPGFSWWQPQTADCGRRWYAYLGPLGIQVWSLNKAFQQHAGFDAVFPDELKDTDGRLIRNGFLVTEIFPGAPAADHLEVGDVILAIEGESLLDAMLVDPTTDYRTKSVRNLALHAGWLIDRAEGRGAVDLRVLRGLLDREYREVARATATPDGRLRPIAADLAGARFLKLVVDGTDGDIHQRWANWITPTLSGPDKPDIDLAATEWLSGTTGWRSIQQGLDARGQEVAIDGKPVTAIIGTHAKSEIVFRIPDGYDRFTASIHLGGNRPVIATVMTAPETVSQRLSRDFVTQHQITVAEGGERHDGPDLNEAARTTSFHLPLGQATRISLESRGNPSHHWGWSNWIKPRLLGPNKPPIDLTQTDWLAARTGWGRVRIGTDCDNNPVLLDGQPVTAVIGAHADSAITWQIPPGYTHFNATFQLGSPRGTIIPAVRLRTAPDAIIDVELANAERVQIRAANADLSLHNLRLVGDGGEVTALAAATAQHAKHHPDRGLLELRANAKREAIFEFFVPPGSWRLRADAAASANSADLTVATLAPAPLPDYLAPFAKAVTVPIQRLGSFKEGFPGDHCPKTQRLTDMTAAWLLAQQQEDGSWPRRAGYCSPALDTSLAVLALLAVDNPQYDAPLRRAIEYLAYRCSYRDWVCPSALALIATSEYYLRTRQDWLVPVIETHLERCRKFIYGDFTCGHGANPGYGDSGVNYGGAHLALGFALANKTPAAVDQRLLDGLMWRVQSLAPGGYVPYGRSTRATFADAPPTAYAAGARTGIYLAAAQLYGGPQHFIDHAARHLCDRTLGGGDQGHASKIFSMMGTTVGIATTDDRSFHEHARRYGWALTLTRRFDGGFHWNSELLEYMGAEPVMNTIYRSATNLLLLNAYKKNLGITGNPELLHRPTNARSLPKLTDSDRRLWHYYRSNWQVVRAVWDNEAPAQLTDACRQLDALERTAGPDMRQRLFAIVTHHGPPLARLLHNQHHPKAAALAELLLGIDLRVEVNLAKDNPAKGDVILTAQHPFVGRFENTTDAEIAAAPPPALPFTGTMTLSGELFASPQTLAFDDDLAPRAGHARKKLTFDLGDRQAATLNLAISYRLGEFSHTANRPIQIPHTRHNNRIVRVPGTIARDHLRHSVSLLLPDGNPLECVNVSYEGRADVAIPVTYAGKTLFSDVRPTFPLVAHAAGDFGYQSDLSRVVPVAITDARITAIPNLPIHSLTIADNPVPTTAVTDWDHDTTVDFKLSPTGEATLVCELRNPATPAKFLLVLGKGANLARVESWQTDRWQTIAGGDARNALQYLVAEPTNRLRLTIAGKPNRTVQLQELHFYHLAAPPKSPQAGL